MPELKAFTDEGYLDTRFHVLMTGLPGGIMSIVGNMVLDILKEEYPKHYTPLMVLDDPDWEDWRDFLSLNNQEKRLEEQE